MRARRVRMRVRRVRMRVRRARYTSVRRAGHGVVHGSVLHGAAQHGLTVL